MAGSPQELLEQAEYFAAALDFPRSASFYQQIIATGSFSSNHEVLEDYSLVLLELGQFSEAHQLLQRCVELSPNVGFSKYMSLGQMSGGHESLSFYKKGIEILLREIQQAEKDGKKEETEQMKHRLSSAYISASEIFMTDCCFEKDAEKQAEQFIQLAMNCNSEGYEALQALASFRISQCRQEDALQILQRSYGMWKDVPLGELPPFDFRKSTAKLFMELQQTEVALKVIDVLIDEDDDVFDVWYLRGLANYSLNERETAKEDFSEAMKIFSKHELQDDPQQNEIAVQIRQLVQEIESGGSANSSVGGGGDDEMEDI